MIVPHYWAEAKRKTVVGGKHYTIKRFGWSDSSEAEALANAQERVDAAIAEVEAGKHVRRADHKIPYNGAEGLPIREEVISRHDETVITRNSYGALCLNTPDVLFADIDFQYEPTSRQIWLSFLLLAALALTGGLYTSSWAVAALLLVVGVFTTSWLARVISNLQWRFKGGREAMALRPIRDFVARHPEWNLRLYRTPRGYRLLAMHRRFAPRAEETLRFFSEIGADAQYVQMCKNQNCFRARVSPKPWRIGMDRLRPRPGVWPIKAEHMEARRQWVVQYDEQSRGFASCRFVEQLGSTTLDPTVETVRRLHDELCRADSQQILA